MLEDGGGAVHAEELALHLNRPRNRGDWRVEENAAGVDLVLGVVLEVYKGHAGETSGRVYVGVWACGCVGWWSGQCNSQRLRPLRCFGCVQSGRSDSREYLCQGWVCQGRVCQGCGH